MTTLNGLPRSWDSFIQRICARRKLITFIRIWEECTQEVAQLITREENMGATEDQALSVHIIRNNRKKEYHHHNIRKDYHHKRQNKFRRDPSICDEKGHYSIDCPINRGSSNNNSRKKIHHAHTAEDDEPNNKIFREEKEYSSIDEEYVL